MALPTPLGAEATAIVRDKDENSPLLRYSVLTRKLDTNSLGQVPSVSLAIAEEPFEA